MFPLPFETGKIDALQELLGQYDEPTATWVYTKALVAYVKQGDSAEARKLLKEALDYNPHVAPYLLGEKRLPRELPQRIGFGDKDEAIAYAAEFGPGWRRHPAGHGGHGRQVKRPPVFRRCFCMRLNRKTGDATRKGRLEMSQKGRQSGRAKLPVATVAYYGPDDKTPTKVAVGIEQTS